MHNNDMGCPGVHCVLLKGEGQPEYFWKYISKHNKSIKYMYIIILHCHY